MNGSLLVAKNGQIILKNTKEWRILGRKDQLRLQLHPLASVSKVITATAILKLIDANKIKLDQSQYDIKTYPEVTIKTLLNHRSGMRSMYFT
jgi:CubicO group peptidase (beta-lactamase class C family)